MNRKAYLQSLDVPEFLEKPEVRAFVGKNFEHYKSLWLSDYNKSKSAAKMSNFHRNTLAFLFLPAWFAYRKMWACFLAWCVIILFAAVFEIYAEYNWNYQLHKSSLVVFNFFLALQSKSIYFYHVTDFFRKNRDVPSYMLEPMIEKNGGVSSLYAILGTIGFIAALFVAAIIAMQIWPTPGEV